VSLHQLLGAPLVLRECLCAHKVVYVAFVLTTQFAQTSHRVSSALSAIMNAHHQSWVNVISTIMNTTNCGRSVRTCLSDRGKFAIGTLAGGLGENDQAFLLAPQFSKMVVKTQQAKEYMGGTLGYSYHMRNLGQIDHAVCTTFARVGTRYVYLDLHHGQLCPAHPIEVSLLLKEMLRDLGVMNRA
jgi:hypothetical protein